jgi:hypothetical protein
METEETSVDVLGRFPPKHVLIAAGGNAEKNVEAQSISICPKPEYQFALGRGSMSGFFYL